MNLISPEEAKSAKTRPSLVISLNELNQHLRTVIVVPMTTGGQAYPLRVRCRFRDRSGFVAIDQLRTIDGERLIRRVGRIAPNTLTTVLALLREMFSHQNFRVPYPAASLFKIQSSQPAQSDLFE